MINFYIPPIFRGSENIGSVIDYNVISEQLKDNLPTLPTVFESLSEMPKDPNSIIDSIQRETSPDQTLTMKVLRVANMSHYRGERDRVTDVGEAIGTRLR